MADHEHLPVTEKTSLCVWTELFAQTNLDRSITVLPKKKLNAKRRDYFPKTELVGSHFFVRRTCAETEPTQPTQEPTQASLTAVVLVDFQTFCACLEICRTCSLWEKKHKNTSYQGTQQDDEINVTPGTSSMCWCDGQHF